MYLRLLAEMLRYLIQVGRQYHQMIRMIQQALHHGAGTFIGIMHIGAFKQFIHQYQVRLCSAIASAL